MTTRIDREVDRILSVSACIGVDLHELLILAYTRKLCGKVSSVLITVS